MGGFQASEKTAKLMLRMMNAEYLETIATLKTDDLPAKEDRETLEQVEKLAVLLNQAP